MDDSISESWGLDEIDKEIITLLQDSPNITHSAIAKQIGRSQPAVGSRIHRLEGRGVISSQFGVNFKNTSEEIHLVTVQLATKKPEEVYKMGTHCPFIINCMKLSGINNMMIFLACSNLKKIDMVVDYHFRNKDYISNIQMDIVTDFCKDFILPIDFEMDEHDPKEQIGCGEKCAAFESRLAKI